MNYFIEVKRILKALYGKDIPMSFCTVDGDKPNVRVIDVYYKEKIFYAISYALSKKVKELQKNKNVALNYNLFVAHGFCENIGHPLDKKNKILRDELKNIFLFFMIDILMKMIRILVF